MSTRYRRAHVAERRRPAALGHDLLPLKAVRRIVGADRALVYPHRAVPHRRALPRRRPLPVHVEQRDLCHVALGTDDVDRRTRWRDVTGSAGLARPGGIDIHRRSQTCDHGPVKRCVRKAGKERVEVLNGELAAARVERTLLDGVVSGRAAREKYRRMSSSCAREKQRARALHLAENLDFDRGVRRNEPREVDLVEPVVTRRRPCPQDRSPQ